MAHDELDARGVLRAAALIAVVVVVAIGAVFALLKAWHEPPGGAPLGGAALREAIGTGGPVLQTAPQLDRARDEWARRQPPAPDDAASAGTPASAARAPGITQRLGAALPLDARFTDADDRALRLGELFGPDRRPLVLLFADYRCSHLCETATQGVLEALAESGARRSSYRVVGIGIDPASTPATAREVRARDLRWAELAQQRADGDGSEAARPLALHLLVGDEAAIEAVTEAAGFAYVREASGDRDGPFVHAAGFLVVTPGGRVSRYFFGVRHSADEVRAALDEATADRVGGLAERLLLLCSHLDPRDGRWSGAVLLGLRVLGLGLALALGVWAWRHRGGRTGAA